MYKLDKKQSEKLCSSVNGRSKGFARETVFSFFVCSLNSKKDFPNLFDWDQLEIVDVDETFFPVVDSDVIDKFLDYKTLDKK